MVWLALVISVMACSPSSAAAVEGFVYLKTSPDRIAEVSGIPRYMLTKPLMWQFQIGSFADIDSCRSSAKRHLGDVHPSEHQGWMCGTNCKVDPDLQTKYCTVLDEQ